MDWLPPPITLLAISNLCAWIVIIIGATFIRDLYQDK